MRPSHPPHPTPKATNPTSGAEALESAPAVGMLKAFERLIKTIAAIDTPGLRWKVAAALLLTIASKVAAVWAPFALADGINGLTEAGGLILAPFLLAVSLWGLARLFANITPQARDALFASVSEQAQRHLGVAAFRHIHSLSVRFHQTKRTGGLQRVLERGTRALDFLLRFLFFTIVPTLFELVLAGIALTLAYGPVFSAITLATILLYSFVTFTITDWRASHRRTMNEADQEANARAVDSLLNYETVKAFAAEEIEVARFDRAVGAYARAAATSSQSLALLNAAQGLIMTFGLVAVAGFAGNEIVNGRMGVGDVMAVILILTNLYQPLNILGFAYREIKQASVDMEKLFALFDQKPDVSDAADAEPIAVKGGSVSFKGVSFAFSERANGLTGVSFHAEPGESIAIVGPSGAGKSTLMRLLFRFYDPTTGAIEIDGQDLRSVTQSSLRKAIGLVPQDVVLFNDTIEANIAYGKPEADHEAIREAARKAQLLDFIESLPLGWKTKVGERGLKLSGGERQRMGIARAILKDPAILVLDEATSALDSGTEAEVQAALEAAAAGRTTLVIAHRLSTIAQADQILVLAQGEIVEHGRHDQLLAASGLYAEMWARQSGAEEQTGPEALPIMADGS